jgi:PAS domain S-box-containing protein
MGATTEENRVAALEAELTALREELEALRRKSHRQSTDAADAAVASTRREHRHDREMASERGRTAAAEGRADRAESRHTDLSAAHELLLKSSEFSRIILQTMTDRVSLLDLDGRIEFMNAGGQRAMEIDNFSQVAGHPWIDLWQGNERVKAGEAVEAAKAGHTTQFEGPANTAKGNRRFWEATLSPIFGPNGNPIKLLSVSRDVTARHEAELHRRLLFEEMHHRIKNTLATVQAITHQSMRQSADMAEAELSISQRLVAMGKAHDLLILNEWIRADIRDVVSNAVRAYIGNSARMTLEGPSIVVSSKAALTIAMLLHELCTNAFKYGAWSNTTGIIDITWQLTDRAFNFRWVERGGPPVEPPSRRSFGSRLIENLMPTALDGRATLSFAPTGFVFELQAPSPALTDQTPIKLP